MKKSVELGKAGGKECLWMGTAVALGWEVMVTAFLLAAAVSFGAIADGSERSRGFSFPLLEGRGSHFGSCSCCLLFTFCTRLVGLSLKTGQKSCPVSKTAKCMLLPLFEYLVRGGCFCPELNYLDYCSTNQPEPNSALVVEHNACESLL